MSLNMICNFKKCRRPLPSIAWVTSCSHAFCEEHGESEFTKKSTDIINCPACNTELGEKFDVVQADLNPPEAFKSIVLAGMKPDVVMDIAMRAISFWSYQIEEETKYQENIGKHARERAQSIQEYHSLNLQKIKAELQSSKNKIESLQTEHNKQKKQAEEYAAKLDEKNRKIQKLQYQLDCQKRNSFHINAIENEEPKKSNNMIELVTNRFQPSPKFVFDPFVAKNKKTTSSDNEFTPVRNNPNTFVFQPMLYENQ